MSLAITGIFIFLFGLSSSLLLLFIIVRFFARIGHSGYAPSCSKSIAENYSYNKRTFVKSLILSNVGIGGVLPFVLGTRIISFDWRYAYFILGFLYILSIVSIFFLVQKKENIKKVEKITKKKVLLTLLIIKI